MRIGVAWEPGANACYRAADPMNALAARGHEIVPPPDGRGELDPRRLAGCDVVHVYRRANDDARRVLRQLAQSGVAITYDNDDDLSALPKESTTFRTHGGLEGQRIFNVTVKAGRMAGVMTTTSDVLADAYLRAGVPHVEVIENSINPAIARPRYRHDGVVVGWVAATEHHADAARLRIVDALERVLAAHPEVRVETIGVSLGLSERHANTRHVDLVELPARMASWDIAIAPLVDIPWNRARSDIKLKEYAASGIPWLASPVGPYAALGEQQGGRLVEDEGWFDALDRLVSRPRERRRLARRGSRWAAAHTIDATADRWEGVLRQALIYRRASAPPVRLVG